MDRKVPFLALKNGENINDISNWIDNRIERGEFYSGKNKVFMLFKRCMSKRYYS